MYISVQGLARCTMVARDGDVGHVREVYFDDERWAIRHVVVDTGGWLGGRTVLISPHAVSGIDLAQGRIDVALGRKQVEDAPDVDIDRPVSRRKEAELYDYYGYPYWWDGAGLWGTLAIPLGGRPSPAEDENEAREIEQRGAEQGARYDPQLRSNHEVAGYHVEARDGPVGRIEDFLFDDRSWAIRFIVVDTQDWLQGRRVLVSPELISSIRPNARTASFDIKREQLESSPAFDISRGPLFEDEVVRLQEIPRAATIA